MNEPLVSVNIISYNRKNELRYTLQKVFAQEYKNIEVIVVDNSSSDGTQEMVTREFPNVKLIQMNDNIGISAWNKGFEISNGEYILVLDDDSYPEKNSIQRALEVFNEDNKIGIVAFNIYNSKYEFYETHNYPRNIISFVGCGALIDSRKLKTVGFYDENLFIYLNELELSARFWDYGFKVVFCKEATCIHNQSLKSREVNKNPFRSSYRYKHFFWGMSYFILTKIDFPNSYSSLVKWIVNRFLISIRYLFIKEFMVGCFNIVQKSYIIRKNRKPLKKEVQEFYRNGNLFAWIDRDYFPEFKK